MKFSSVILSSLFVISAVAAPQPQRPTRSVSFDGGPGPQPQPTTNWGNGGNGGGRPQPTTNWGNGGNGGGRPPQSTQRPRTTTTQRPRTTTTTQKPRTTTSTKKTTTAKPQPTQPSGDAPNPNEVFIRGVSYGGSGCPQGSASVNISDRSTRVTIMFQEYFAEAGPGINQSANRRNCQINVNLQYPGGFAYSVWSSTYRGFVALDQGVKAVQSATYYFSGETKQAKTESVIEGPRNSDYLINDEVPFTSVVWAPCGRQASLNINSQVRVDNSANRDGQGLMQNDSMDGKVEYVVGLKWQKC